MRVRLKLDEERIAELLKGVDSSAIPGLMRHLGDVASLSFTPYQNGELQLLRSAHVCYINAGRYNSFRQGR